MIFNLHEHHVFKTHSIKQTENTRKETVGKRTSSFLNIFETFLFRLIQNHAKISFVIDKMFKTIKKAQKFCNKNSRAPLRQLSPLNKGTPYQLPSNHISQKGSRKISRQIANPRQLSDPAQNDSKTRRRSESRLKQERQNSSCKCEQKSQRQQLQDQKLFISLLQEQKGKRVVRPQPCRISIDLDQLRNKKVERQGERQGKISISPTRSRKISNHNAANNSYLIILSEQTPEPGQNRYPFEKQRPKFNGLSSMQSRKISKDIRQSPMPIGANSNQSHPSTKGQATEAKPQQSDKLVRFDEIDKTDDLLRNLFAKLTANNLPYQHWINYLNFNYKILSMEELHFIGILFDRIDPAYLSSMNFYAPSPKPSRNVRISWKNWQKCRLGESDRRMVVFEGMSGRPKA